jgi:Bacterial Ig-like domain (group 2)
MRRTLSSILPRAAAVALLATGLAACSRDTDTLEPEPLSTDGTVFVDAFGRGVSFQGFAGSNTNALHIDSTTKHAGIASIRFTVPQPNDPAGTYSGGAFVAEVPRDLTGFDALTFWARASRAASLDVVGIGNDNTGTSKFTAERNAVALTTEWQKIVIPIPLASKLVTEKGMFYIAEGAENGVGYNIWLDDIKYEKLGTITNPRPVLVAQTLTGEIGNTTKPIGGVVTFSVGGTDVSVDADPGYFTYTSSNTSVATIGTDGTITAVGAGSANITATLGTTPATGTLPLTTFAPPTAAAPTPTRAAADVVSLFSNAYTNVPVTTWSASWDGADVADVQVGGNATKKYTNLTFAGIEFTAPTVDASTMTHLHMDVWVNSASAFKVKLVDFGANGAFGGGDDKEHEITLSTGTTPAVAAGQWNSLDIPLSMFTGLTTTGHLAQMIISGSSPTVYLDNVYFYRAAVVAPTAPTTAAPTPTYTAANAIALFSNAYTNRTVDTWSASWDQADVADVQVAGNDTKKYTNLVFAGIEFTTAMIDASTMTHLRMDIWTPDATTAASFKVKLVDFGANAAFGGGDDVEHELTFTRTTTPALATGSWVTLDIPLSQFTGLTTKGHLAQLIIAGDLRTLYVDNVLLHK